MMLGQHSSTESKMPLPQETVSWEQNFPESKKHFEPERGLTGAAARLLRQWLEAEQRWCGNSTPSPQPGNLTFKNKAAFSFSNLKSKQKQQKYPFPKVRG